MIMFRAVTDIMEDIIDEDGEIIFKKDTVVGCLDFPSRSLLCF
jgi:hypothetical protein